MGDSLSGKIDRFFDAFDAGIDETSHLIDRAKRTIEKRRPIDVLVTEPSKRPATPSKARPRVRIIESIDAQTGKPTWVVTDGVARSECSSKELASRVAAAMEAH